MLSEQVASPAPVSAPTFTPATVAVAALAAVPSLAAPVGQRPSFDAERALALAARTFEIEAAALLGLAARQGDGFAGAVAAVLDCRGRVIVMGMGKSGHVGRKIAATLASTGTPAFFVHPAEASHGDLGLGQPHPQIHGNAAPVALKVRDENLDGHARAGLAAADDRLGGKRHHHVRRAADVGTDG